MGCVGGVLGGGGVGEVVGDGPLTRFLCSPGAVPFRDAALLILPLMLCRSGLTVVRFKVDDWSRCMGQVP